MARNRMIKVDFWKDPKVGNLSYIARLIFIGMWNFADDSGVVRGDPNYLRSEIFPYDNLTTKKVQASLQELIDKNFIFEIRNNDEDFLWVKKFLKHQTVTNPSKFRYVDIPEDNYKQFLTKDYDSTMIGLSLKEKEKEKGKEKEDEKDMAEEIIDYLKSVSGKKFRYVDSNFKFIRARIREGYTQEDFKHVIDIKCAQWLQDSKMDKFIRPATLFNPTNFESYLNERAVSGRGGGTSWDGGVGSHAGDPVQKKETPEEKYTWKKEWVERIERVCKEEGDPPPPDCFINDMDKKRFIEAKKFVLDYEFEHGIKDKIK